MKRTDVVVICSLSGGETSAYMALWLRDHFEYVIYIYANTGLENEETLEFIDKLDRAYDFGVVWLEAKINKEAGKGTDYSIVNFDTASRNGEPFERMIEVYGLPNPQFPHCTRELKSTPIGKYVKDNHPDSIMAIGIRSDELDRISPKYKENNLCYPLAFWHPTTKNEVNSFWDKHSFRLNLKHYQGNCKTCYKKSFRKLAWIAKENPEHFDFFERMEKEHAFSGNRKNMPEEGARIFRHKKTVKDIREMSLIAVEPIDDARVYEVNGDLFGYEDMDLDMCGSESCEAF